jgi:hypothetical protein
LVEDEGDVDLRRGLVEVWNDAADEVRLSVVELGEEDRELFLVALTDGSERSFPYPRSRTGDGGSVEGGGGFRFGVLGEESGNVRVGGLREEGGDVVVERVAVLLEPAFGAVLDFAGVMRDGEALFEAGGGVLRELRGGRFRRGELVELVGELSRGRASASPLLPDSDERKDVPTRHSPSA